MKLSEAEVKALFAPLIASGKLPSISHYLSIEDSDVDDSTHKIYWETELDQRKKVSHINENDLIGIYLYAASESGVNAILMVAQLKDITAATEGDITLHLTARNREEDNSSFLDTLKKEWKKDPSKYIFTLSVIFETAKKCIYISERLTAPSYRKRGIMKDISLAFLRKSYQAYGDELRVEAYTIHPATYLFFNLHDRQLKFFDRSDGQNQSVLCKELLEMHHAIPKPMANPDQVVRRAQRLTMPLWINYDFYFKNYIESNLSSLSKKIPRLTFFQPNLSRASVENISSSLSRVRITS